jgi:hypothetical protein
MKKKYRNLTSEEIEAKSALAGKVLSRIENL